MVGLYDREGMLRFVGSSLEACVEYADLFQIQLAPSSLQDLDQLNGVIIRGRRRGRAQQLSRPGRSCRCPSPSSARPPGFSSRFW